MTHQNNNSNIKKKNKLEVFFFLNAGKENKHI